MKSVKTPHVRVGYTKHEVTAQVGGPSKLKEDLTIPANTRCHDLGTHWVVDDLSWLKPGTITYHDADHYGIAINESDIERISQSIRRA